MIELIGMELQPTQNQKTKSLWASFEGLNNKIRVIQEEPTDFVMKNISG